MTHPLNDELGQIIWKVANEKSWEFTQEDLMCAIADWQLEQVIEWLKDELDYRSDIDPNLLSDLKKAMRPQQQEDN